jgi:hypothetical protein
MCFALWGDEDRTNDTEQQLQVSYTHSNGVIGYVYQFS